jgi:hypothetical protein
MSRTVGTKPAGGSKAQAPRWSQEPVAAVEMSHRPSREIHMPRSGDASGHFCQLPWALDPFEREMTMQLLGSLIFGAATLVNLIVLGFFVTSICRRTRVHH